MPPPHEFSCWSGVIVVAVLVHPTGVSPDNPGATDHWQRTIARAVPFRSGPVVAALQPREAATLARLHPDGTARFWGAHGDHRARLARLSEGDVVVLTAMGRVTGVGRAGLVTTNTALGDVLWPHRIPGKGSFLHLYSLTEFELTDLPLSVLRGAGVAWFQSPTFYEGPAAEAVIKALDDAVPSLTGGPKPGAARVDVARPREARPVVEVGDKGREGAPGLLAPQLDELLARLEAMGSTDAAGAVRAVRREQSLLRDALGIGQRAGDDLVRCGLCGRHLPRGLVVAAHVKPRSECTEEERRDVPNVVMAACLLGCDALYEAGYLTVDSRGRVVTARRGLRTSPLIEALRGLEGRAAPAWTPGRECYFEWHRTHRFREQAARL
jgi:hypothetical protein